MSAALCEPCSAIPAYFWSEEMDDQGFPWGRFVRLQSFRSMEAAAGRGCPLCKILLHSAQVDFLDDRALEGICVTLSRAILDSGQGVCLAVRNDDISHTTFFRVPEPWDEMPPIGMDQPINNVQLMKGWIEKCRTEHDLCWRWHDNFLPTRLLDLRAFEDSQDIRLVSLRIEDIDPNEFIPDYIALSHCWGPSEKRPITTTSLTMGDRMTRIPFNSLSLTFQDAVRITRDLGERYLWIDSLCIIQDDEQDWAKEAALMPEVYGQAICTLAALSAKDGTEGCRQVEDIQDKICPFVDLDFEDERSGLIRVRVFAEEPSEWHEEYGDNPYRHRDYGNQPLRQRAWTLQERELSRRSVHFASEQLLWECYESRASSQLPWHEKKPQDDFKSRGIRNDVSESSAPDGPIAVRDRWYELMEDYSSRSLTKETDMLPALSGLAQQYQYTFPEAQYIAGTWTTHLPAALLWRSRYGSRPRQPSTYIAPTWSWAALQGEITYGSQRLDHFLKDEDENPQERAAYCDFGGLLVEKATSKSKYDDKYGAITDAQLVLGGARLVSVDPSPQARDFGFRHSGGRRAVLTKDGATVGLFCPDLAGDVAYPIQMFCLVVRGEPPSPEIERPSDLFEGELSAEEAKELVMGLVLAKHPQVEGSYVRIGLARWVKKSLFDGAHASSITLL